MIYASIIFVKDYPITGQNSFGIKGWNIGTKDSKYILTDGDIFTIKELKDRGHIVTEISDDEMLEILRAHFTKKEEMEL